MLRYVLVFDLTSHFPALCANTVSTWKCHCDTDSWLQWHSTFQALCWVLFFFLCLLNCFPFEKFSEVALFWVVEGMWRWIRVMGGTCTTILLNQRVNLPRTLWFCGLMGDLAALASMDSYMSMVINWSLWTLPFLFFRYILA